MIRIIKQSNKFYGIKVSLNDEEIENIEGFINEGSPVILVYDLDDLDALDIDPSTVEMIE